MKLEIAVPVTTYDLANAVHDDQGTYLCQQGGQTFLLVAAAGHSIKFGPRPIGRSVQEVSNPFTSMPEPWIVTKIADDDISEGFGPAEVIRTSSRK